MIKSVTQHQFFSKVYAIVYNISSKTVYIQMSIIKLLCLSKTSIILKIFNYFCRYKFKNRLRNFQPENGERFKNKPGCPKIVVLMKKSVGRSFGQND